MKSVRIQILFFALSILLVGCEQKQGPAYYVKSVAEPIINLNGDWHINTSPGNEFWLQHDLDDKWKQIKVPGEVMMQGFSVKNDEPFAYRKEIDIPKDYQGNAIYLQFDGVYSYARVWINGNYVRDHYGGFTRWKCDITPYVKAGEKAILTLEVTDRADDISYASGYAKHQIAGILRDVNLLALPVNHPENIMIETDLDDNFQNSELILSGKLKSPGQNSKIGIKLFDASNTELPLQKNSITLTDTASFKISNHIVDPKKWDAEHPNLYVLEISYYENDELLWSKHESFGFREVEVEGNVFKVNGKPVKLRGACRHDVHPTLGRVATPEYELKDVLLAKEANMNFIRTSHYPPSDNFLKLCDEYGLYVQAETAVCFVIDYRIKGYEIASNSQSDSTYTERYLSQLEEMVDSQRNHPSVIIWSIGNENIYGSNFKKSFDWVKKHDTTRPIMFSYPGTAPDSITPYQILSMHYPNYKGDLNQYNKITEGFGFKEMPVIFDEWAHVACYNNETIREDPNIRDFWGQSLDMMWAKTFDSDGGLGGAIWGMIDETFMLPEDLEGFRDWWGINDNTILPYKGTTVGYGEWGIVDVWRRKKPEFWNTKKAYSPIKILKTSISDYKQGSDILLPIYNRFDHTDLNEITIKYTYKDSTKTLIEFNLKPHEIGTLRLPMKEWDVNEKITIDFYSNNDLVDSYKVGQYIEKTEKTDLEVVNASKITLDDKDKELIVHTDIGALVFDKSTGLLSKIQKDGQTMTISGPKLTYKTKGKGVTYSSNEINSYGNNWKLNKFTYELMNNKVVVNLEGSYNTILANYRINIVSNGEITTNYSFQNLPKEYVRELGIHFDMDAIFDELSWNREGYWTTYPENHLSAIHGKVQLYSKVKNNYREKPNKSWVEDTKSFYYDGTKTEDLNALTYIAKATKLNVMEYSLLKNGAKFINVLGSKELSCRLAKKDDVLNLFINNITDYVDLSWGNYQHNIMLNGSYSGEVKIQLN